VADESEGEWVATPVGADDFVLQISVGQNVELSDEARHAIEKLIGDLEGAEVTGHAASSGCLFLSGSCGKYSCELGKCQPESRRPCAMDYKCKIASLF
jgi:hypothetical protein